MINGDEPHYLVEAESISRYFTLNMSPGYSYIINHHIIYPFVAKPGPKVAAALGNSYLSHGLYLPSARSAYRCCWPCRCLAGSGWPRWSGC